MNKHLKTYTVNQLHKLFANFKDYGISCNKCPISLTCDGAYGCPAEYFRGLTKDDLELTINTKTIVYDDGWNE